MTTVHAPFVPEHLELPEHTAPNPARRAAVVQAGAVEAPDRAAIPATRSVQIAMAEVKEAAEGHLRNQYTNADGVMICQMCRDELPLRRADGAHYFEKVSFLPGLDQRHHQNYLALCPNHGAMFQYANPLRDAIRGLFLDMDGSELAIVVGGAPRTVYFTEVHRDDIPCGLAATADPGHRLDVSEHQDSAEG